MSSHHPFLIPLFIFPEKQCPLPSSCPSLVLASEDSALPGGGLMALIVSEYIEPGPCVDLQRVVLLLATSTDKNKAGGGWLQKSQVEDDKVFSTVPVSFPTRGFRKFYRIINPPWKSWQKIKESLGFWRCKRVFSENWRHISNRINITE